MISKYYKFFPLILVLAGFQTTFAQYKETIVAAEPENVAVVYNNGNLETGPTSKSGVAAPAGFVWSETQNDTGNTTETNSVVGFGAQFNSSRLADNFTIPAGQTWVITSVTTYGYRNNWTNHSSPYAGASLRVWKGRPDDAGSTVIFGDTTTNRLLSSTATNIYRISNSQVPSPGIAPVTTRRVWENKLSIAPSLTLGPGTYWIDFDFSNFDNNVQDHFVPSVTVLNQRTQAGWNARRLQLSTGTWADVLDGGLPAAAPDVPQDIAFKVTGTVASSNNAAKFLDFDGDGKTDFGVTRWGPAPTSASTWFILLNTASQNHYQLDFGQRVGVDFRLSGVLTFDKVTPGDFDGDGKTDIAVWRRGPNAANPQATYYILQSSDNVLRIEQFGITNDSSNILGDYDGDGKTDLAIYRFGTNDGDQSYFWVKKSSNSEIFTVPWGIRRNQPTNPGDRAFAGDFDGDGMSDFAVARVTDTESNAYILHANGSISIKPIKFPYTFIVPGDYDGDGKTDVATIRSENNVMVWTIYRSSDDITEEINCGIYNLDFPAQGDYNGDGKTDLAIYRKTGTGSASPSSFWVRQADGAFAVIPWGNGLDNAVATVMTQ